MSNWDAESYFNKKIGDVGLHFIDEQFDDAQDLGFGSGQDRVGQIHVECLGVLLQRVIPSNLSITQRNASITRITWLLCYLIEKNCFNLNIENSWIGSKRRNVEYLSSHGSNKSGWPGRSDQSKGVSWSAARIGSRTQRQPVRHAKSTINSFSSNWHGRTLRWVMG